jgi:hypothetical protein
MRRSGTGRHDDRRESYLIGRSKTAISALAHGEWASANTTTNATLSLSEIYLEIPPEEIAYVKFIFESYEGVGIIRTVDRKRATIALLAMNDFLDTARSILASLKEELPLREIPRPQEIGEDWLVRELVTDDSAP